MSFDIFGPYDNSLLTTYKSGANYTYRVWIPPDLLLGCTGQFTITLGYNSTYTWYIDKVGVCSSAGDEASYTFEDSIAEQVYFPGGVANVTISSGTGVIVSQPIDYLLDTSKGLILSFELGATSSYFPVSTNALFAQCVTYRDTGDFALSGAFAPDYTYTGTLGGIIAGIGLTTVNMMAGNIPSVHSEWTNLILEDAAGGNYANGVLGLMECEATGVQATVVIGTLPAVECEASGGLNVHCTLDSYLPAIECEASIGTHLSLDADLPTVSCEARAGSRGEDGRLPAVTGEGSIGSVYVGRLDRMLPGIRCEAFCGARLDERIPTVSCEASASFPGLGSLDKSIPGITGEASGYGGPGAWLDRDIPVIRGEGVITCSPVITLDETLPGIRGIASGRWCGAILDERIPAVISGEGSCYESSVHGSLDGMLPAVIMAGEGYGDGGDGGGSISDRTRFTDYILRFDRWA